MAKKKPKSDRKMLDTTSEQVMKEDTITIAEVKTFIEDCRKDKRQDFINIADRSWDEIEKRNRRGGLYGGADLYRRRQWTKFPLWWSCWKIRQPIVFARMPVPMLKDTQGDDPFGRTACVVGERFIKSILKTFDAFTEFASGIDDFLVTNFGWGRWFYKTELCVEDEKIRLQIVKPPPMEGMEPQEAPQPILVNPATGEQVTDESQVLEDDMGPYILSGQKVDVESESVYFESQLYSALYIENDTRKWNEVTRCAMEYNYSYRDFKKKFGEKALEKISLVDIEQHKTGKPIIVFEYWDEMLKECRWLAENSDDFFQPEGGSPTTYGLKEIEGAQEDYDNSDLYGLSSFYPCTEPLIFNNTPRNFWPTPEFFQVADIIEHINSVFSRAVLLTKAIRIRFLFDSSVPQLKELIGETGEGGGIGIPNLEKALIAGKGSLAMLVQYMPIDDLLSGLNNMYNAFNQGLDTFYQITGMSDLIRGQTNPDSDKTYGERQMEGKFALNRIEPYQRKAQEWVKNNLQIGMEMGLKMFSESTVDEYIVPQTLDDEDKQRYVGALALLKDNKRSRFRVDFETDSTIAINENWRRQQAIETANIITKMLESTASVAETQPALAKTELKIMEHVIGELTNGKLFIDEVKASIQETIDAVAQPKDQEPNIELEKIKLEGAKFQFEQQKQIKEDQLEEIRIQANQQIEIAKLQQNDRLASLESNVQQFKIQSEQQLKLFQLQESAQESQVKLQQSQSELQLEYQRISADIAQAEQELLLKREQLMIEVAKVTDKKEVDQFALMLDARTRMFEERLATAQQQLDAKFQAMEEQEKILTEIRLQSEHKLDEAIGKVDILGRVTDVVKSLKETKQMDVTPAPKVEEPKAKKAKLRRTKVTRNKNNDIEELLTTIEDLE